MPHPVQLTHNTQKVPEKHRQFKIHQSFILKHNVVLDYYAIYVSNTIIRHIAE